MTEPETQENKEFTEEEIEKAMEEWQKQNKGKDIDKETKQQAEARAKAIYTTKATPTKQKLKTFHQNPTLYIWAIIYFIITWWTLGLTAKALIITAITNTIIIAIALSDTIETILRHIEDARKPATSKEKERLIPLYKEIHQKAKKQTPSLSKHTKLYIVDEIAINAFALGNNTIAITRGLIETMNDDEIKGILAHEMGHIAHNDPRTKTLITTGSTIYLWGLHTIRWALKTLEKTTATEIPLAKAILAILNLIIELTINLITIIGTILLMADSREKEYRADQYAAQIGYKDELKQALYKLYDLQISDKRKIIQRFKASHPRIAYRIEKLEQFENIYNER